MVGGLHKPGWNHAEPPPGSATYFRVPRVPLVGDCAGRYVEEAPYHRAEPLHGGIGGRPAAGGNAGECSRLAEDFEPLDSGGSGGGVASGPSARRHRREPFASPTGRRLNYPRDA